jgi:hypothetical protein
LQNVFCNAFELPSLKKSRGKTDIEIFVEILGKVFDTDFLPKYLYGVFELPLPRNAQKRTKKNPRKKKAGCRVVTGGFKFKIWIQQMYGYGGPGTGGPSIFFLAVDRISSASPQLGAAKRGQEAGIAPGRSPPAQPRPPPGPKGLPEGAKRAGQRNTRHRARRPRGDLQIAVFANGGRGCVLPEPSPPSPPPPRGHEGVSCSLQFPLCACARPTRLSGCVCLLCLLTEQDSALCDLATNEETALALKLV